MNYEVIQECTTLSDEEKITFPEVVHRLHEAGIELYYADLLTCNKTYYAKNTAHTISCSLRSEKQVASAFNAAEVILAIRQAQTKQIKYQEFLRKIMDAGVFAYFVYIQGRKAVYLGRRGEQHIEEFPK